MHDNNPKHTSRLVNTKVLKCPAQSPDLNPIDNLRSEVEKRMEEKNPKTADELWQNIETCWKAIPPDRPDIKTKCKKYFSGDFLFQQISGKNSESK